MNDFNTLIAQQPETITTVLISDLHLSPNEPALTQAFLNLLDKLILLPNIQQLFILGDWFEAWLGDDIADTAPLNLWLQPMITKLRLLASHGCQLFIMHGNRDFLIGRQFCNKFGGNLIQAPYYLKLNHQIIRLEHGDALCTDDKKYQRFRQVIQHPLTKRLLLTVPKQKRDHIATQLRNKSKADNAKKSMQIMDVNNQAVKKALENADTLIHGHTHRPCEHQFTNTKRRLVLGDWRVTAHQVTASIAVATIQQIKLVNFVYNIADT